MPKWKGESSKDTRTGHVTVKLSGNVCFDDATYEPYLFSDLATIMSSRFENVIFHRY